MTLSYMISRVGAVEWADHRAERVAVRPSVAICEIKHLHHYNQLSFQSKFTDIGRN